ncbi:MAG: hypothetical protein ABIH38_01845 [Patescibacteria group bacterium]
MKKQKGQILVISTLFLSVIVLLVAVLVSLILGNNYLIQKRYQQKIAFNVAEAGIDRAIEKMNEESTYLGEIINWTEGAQAAGTIVTTVAKQGNIATIESTGYYPSLANPKTEKKIRVQLELTTTDVAFHYGVQVGEGGLIMKNNSEIVGNIYSNGSITGPGVIHNTATVATGSAVSLVNDILKDAEEKFGHNATETDLAQSFISPGTNNITMVSLRLKKVCEGNNVNKCPTGTKVKILGNKAGAQKADDIPDKDNVIAEGTLNPSLASMTQFGWINVAMQTPALLNSGEDYWIVIAPSDASPINYLRHWISSKSSTDEGYGNGMAKYSADWNQLPNPSWTKISGDINFKIFLATNTTYIDGTTINEKAYAYEIKNATIGQEAHYWVVDTNTKANGTTCLPGPNAACIQEEPGGLMDMPISTINIGDWKNEAIAGGTYKVCSNNNDTKCTSDDECVSPGTCIAAGLTLDGEGDDAALGPIKIEGDLKVINNAELKLTGTVYVTGKIDLDNNSKVYLDAGYGSQSGLIINDGEINVSNNVFFCGSGYTADPSPACNTTEPPPEIGKDSYIMFLSTSTKITDIDPAIDVDNNATAVIFYASAGAIKLNNNAGVFEATAHRLIMGENATVTYESGLANAKFISGPGASWAIKKGTWQEL